METAWLFDTLAVTVARIDFLDPEFASEPDIRERGVRVEIRLLESKHDGSIYVSSGVSLQPAVCRIDLLESAPGAADRMHWHPTMPEGEPGDRTFDAAIPADPTGWLAQQLTDVTQLLAQGGVQDLSRARRVRTTDCRARNRDCGRSTLRIGVGATSLAGRHPRRPRHGRHDLVDEL